MNALGQEVLFGTTLEKILMTDNQFLAAHLSTKIMLSNTINLQIIIEPALSYLIFKTQQTDQSLKAYCVAVVIQY